MMQITRAGMLVSGSPETVSHLRAEFERRHCVRIPRLLEPTLLHLIQRRLSRATFVELVHKSEAEGAQPILVETALPKDEPIVGLLHFLANDPQLFSLIEQITGCGPIGCFTGRVYRRLPVPEHYDSWHTDLMLDRLVTLSINLSAEVYGGGILQIRDHDSHKIIHEVANTGCGDAIIFRIAPYLHHRVTKVEGTAAKTAFAGWFRSQPDYRMVLGKKISELKRSVQAEDAQTVAAG